MLIGYARVSTDDQHLDLQRDALTKAGCERVFEDTASGAKADRVGLAALLASLRAGDTVVIWRLDRLGRSLKDLIHLVEQLDAAKVGLRSVQESIDTASIVLAGHPKLKNDLRRPTMEEIGYRTEVFSLDGIAGSQREYLHWLIDACSGRAASAEKILTKEVIDLLATKLRTPLQLQMHLTLALEAGYQTGVKPITTELVESVLSRQLDDLEPTLTRHGYRTKDLVDQFDARPAEIKALMAGTLEPVRAAALRDRMLAAGLPI